MTPNFLLIGAARSGTSWLNEVLARHPDVYTPADREIHFFDRHFAKGWGWYQSLFTPAITGSAKLIGENTPAYLYEPDVPQLIREHLPDVKMVVLLRHPIKRLYSHYTRKIKIEGLAQPFLDYVDTDPHARDRSFYAAQLERYFALFPREQFLILCFEDIIKDQAKLVTELSTFLGIDTKGFSFEDKQVNASYKPRFHALYQAAYAVNNALTTRHIHWPAQLATKLNVKRLFRGSGKKLPQITTAEINALKPLYHDDVTRLKALLNYDFPAWDWD